MEPQYTSGTHIPKVPILPPDPPSVPIFDGDSALAREQSRTCTAVYGLLEAQSSGITKHNDDGIQKSCGPAFRRWPKPTSYDKHMRATCWDISGGSQQHEVECLPNYYLINKPRTGRYCTVRQMLGSW